MKGKKNVTHYKRQFIMHRKLDIFISFYLFGIENIYISSKMISQQSEQNMWFFH